MICLFLPVTLIYLEIAKISCFKRNKEKIILKNKKWVSLSCKECFKYSKTLIVFVLARTFADFCSFSSDRITFYGRSLKQKSDKLNKNIKKKTFFRSNLRKTCNQAMNAFLY